MARLTLVGEQVLAAYPDTGVGRVTLVGEQILADAPLNVTRVSNSSLEVLVQGSPSPNVRLTLAGEQILAATPATPMRVSNSALELLVTGTPPTRGRVSLVGEQILAATPFVPMRVSNSALEVLIAGIPESLSPGRLHAARGTATVSANYPDVSEPQSEATVSAVWQQTAWPSAYEEEGSGGRLHAALRVVSLPSPILSAEPAGRLYATWSTITRDLELLPPSAPLSDLYADAVVESIASSTAYPDAGIAASDLTVSQIGRQAAIGIEYAEIGSDLDVSLVARQTAAGAEYAAAGSDLTVSQLDRRTASVAGYPDKDELQSDLTVDRLYADVAGGAGYPDKDELQSDLTVDRLYAGVAWGTAYLDKDTPQSELSVSALDQRAATGATYPDPASVVPEKRLHQMSITASLPAGWLELQKTMLRLHFAGRQVTLPTGYPDPVDMRPPIEVGYLAPAVAVASTRNLGGGPSATVGGVAQLVAVPAIYEGPDAPQSTVSVDDLALIVVAADNSFGDLISPTVDSLPIVSIQLFYED